MKTRPVGLSLLAGLFLTVPLMAIFYLGQQILSLPFAPFALFDWIARVLPGPVITFGIDAMIDTLMFIGLDVADTAKTAEQLMALAQFLVLLTIAASVFFYLRLSRRGRPHGLLLGALVGLPLLGITIALDRAGAGGGLALPWLLVLFALWGGAAEAVANRLSPPQPEAETPAMSAEPLNRRQFLIRFGAASATITVLGAGVGALLTRLGQDEVATGAGVSEGHNVVTGTGEQLPNLNDPVTPAPGTRPEYTPLKDHYKVFINTQPSIIEEASWTLPVMGMVDNPLNLTLDELRNNYEAHDRYVTLRCISGRIGTGLISTTQWTGLRLQELLDDAGVQEGARWLIMTCEDGYYETLDLQLLEEEPRILLCYDWDGQPLPKDHGFPLRIWIPDVYGMKQPKWIIGMEVTDSYEDGYWVERNWDRDAIVKTTSAIDTVATNATYEQNGQTFVPVGGMAYSGAKSISRVEVRVDGGSWEEARLRSPLSDTTWVIWRYDWPFSEGEHTFEVRAYEGDGTLQITEEDDARPDGASGIHDVEVDV